MRHFGAHHAPVWGGFHSTTSLTMTDDKDLDSGDDIPHEDEAVKARKRKERLEQNRISARESRKRKKTMIEELQRTVITLSRENKELNERNESLRHQLMELGSKVRNFAAEDVMVLVTSMHPSLDDR